jgi:hypothetical protein
MQLNRFASSDDEVQAIVTVTKPPDYFLRYQEFVRATDEKRIIAAEVSDFLRPGTILDIGAGTGEIPDWLGVDRDLYTAIECQPESATCLRHKGYRVIEDLFPCPVPANYDNVLLLHCLYGPEQCHIMVNAAWTLVAADGRLVAVTFRDTLDEYNTLLHRVGHTLRGATDSRFRLLIRTFTVLGRLRVRRLRSYLRAGSVRELANLLSFMATNGSVGSVAHRDDVRRRLMSQEAYLRARSQTDRGDFAFPIDHYLFVVEASERDSI